MVVFVDSNVLPVLKVNLTVFLIPADLTVSKKPGTSNRIEIRFSVFNRLYLLFSFINLLKFSSSNRKMDFYLT